MVWWGFYCCCCCCCFNCGSITKYNYEYRNKYDEHIPVQDNILQYGVNITAQRLATPFNLLKQSDVSMCL